MFEIRAFCFVTRVLPPVTASVPRGVTRPKTSVTERVTLGLSPIFPDIYPENQQVLKDLRYSVSHAFSAKKGADLTALALYSN